MSFLFKDFLRLRDVGEYLNQYEYSYDPEIEEDYYRLKATILDLYHENKLNIVFQYDDLAIIKTLKLSESLVVEEIKDEEFECYISGYFHVPEAISVLEDECHISIIASSYRYYLLHDRGRLPIYDNEDEYKIEVGSKFTSINFGDNQLPSFIGFSDLRFPKADLDKLFNTEHDELKSVKDELTYVKEQNAKLIADGLNAPLTIEDKVMDSRSRNNALKIICALLIKSGWTNHSPTSNQIRGNANTEIDLLLNELGLSVGHETIGKFLKDVQLIAPKRP